MTQQGRNVDGVLQDYGEELFSSKVRKGKQGKSLSGLFVGKKSNSGGGASGGGNKVSRAAGVRSKLDSIAKRSPEVMVKISGGGKGMQQIRNHLDYISRNGQLEAEDQDGNTVNGKEELHTLEESWKYGGFKVPEESNKKEAFNIVLSMPEGTDPVAVKRAARDFAAREFPEHQYVMVQHTFDTDPDPKPSKHPHVHLCVKARSLDGIRLNPRKADLQRWREGFAEALREHGVEAAATKREQRMLRTQSRKATRFKNTTRQLDKTGRVATKAKRSPSDPARVAKAKKTEATVAKRYHAITKALAESPDVEDRKLAVAIVERLQEDRARPGTQLAAGDSSRDKKPAVPEKQQQTTKKRDRDSDIER